MVDVRVSEYECPNVGECAVHRGKLARQVVPVAGRAGIDDGDLAAFLEEVRVHEPRTDAVDPRRDLHRRFAATLPFGPAALRFGRAGLRFGRAVAATVS